MRTLTRLTFGTLGCFIGAVLLPFLGLGLAAFDRWSPWLLTKSKHRTRRSLATADFVVSMQYAWAFAQATFSFERRDQLLTQSFEVSSLDVRRFRATPVRVCLHRSWEYAFGAVVSPIMIETSESKLAMFGDGILFSMLWLVAIPYLPLRTQLPYSD
jgi:hypothetical protein